MSLAILYRDDDLVVIDKPAGLLVHRSNVDRRETRFAVQLLRDQLGCHVHPVHRLDRGTSGVLVFALHEAALRTLAAAFETRAVEKHYLAVVRGTPAEAGLIDHPLARLDDDSAPDATRLQPAQTAWRRLGTAELPLPIGRYETSRYALLALDPLTGRRHQLRRHMKHAAHPIIGDATYGKGAHNRAIAQRFDAPRLLLHCAAMRFAHPATGAPLTVRAEPDAAFTRVLAGMGWQATARAWLEGVSGAEKRGFVTH